MGLIKTRSRILLGLLVGSCFGHFWGLRTTLADSLFVSNYGDGTIGEYTTTGTAVNPSLVAGLDNPTGIALDGNGNLAALLPIGVTPA